MSDSSFLKLKPGEFSAYMWHCANNAFNFSGRASQKEYYVYLQAVFAYSIVATALTLLGGYVANIEAGVVSTGASVIDTILTSVSVLVISLMIPLSAVYMLFAFFMIFLSLSVSIRRLHDADQSGWWVIPIFLGVGILTTLVGFLVGMGLVSAGIPVNPEGGIVAVISIVLSLAQLVLLGFVMLRKPSDSGSNRFGEPASYEV